MTARAMATLVVIAAALVACGGDDGDDGGGADGTDAITVPAATVDETTESAGVATTGAASSTEVPTSTDAPAATDAPPATDLVATTDGDGDDDEGAGDEQAYVDAIAVEFVELDDEELSTCISQAIVDAIGFDRIEASGLSPEELADVESFADADLAPEPAARATMQSELAGCGDLVGAVAAAAGEGDETQAQCVRESFDNELMAELLVSQIAGQQPSAELLAARDEARECAGDE